MNSGTLALLIPIIAIIGGVILSAMSLSQKNKIRSKQQTQELDLLKQTVSRLQQRVEVLERLATEEHQPLKREFERL